MKIEHEAQLAILKKLLFEPKLRFSQLNDLDLDSNHFNFHLKRLVSEGIVIKQNELYHLSAEGLELAGRMNVDTMEMVRQPKVGVCICVLDNKNNVLLGKRLRDPGKDLTHFYTRKVAYNQSLYKTAEICLKEETGLEAIFTFLGTVRFLQKDMDNLMLCLTAVPTTKVFLPVTKESQNAWYSYDEVLKLRNVLPHFQTLLKKYITAKPFSEEVT